MGKRGKGNSTQFSLEEEVEQLKTMRRTTTRLLLQTLHLLQSFWFPGRASIMQTLNKNTTHTSMDPLPSSELISRTGSYHLETEQNPVKATTSASLLPSSNPDQTQLQRSLSHGPPIHSDGEGSPGTPAFLARPPDVQWIDIEKMGRALRET
jgi:hypothetical protein